MNSKIYENLYPNVDLLTKLAIISQAANSKLTPEEREQKKLRLEEIDKIMQHNSNISNGICPSGDGGKLTRGKKDKKNDYKRYWTCDKCNKKYYKED